MIGEPTPTRSNRSGDGGAAGAGGFRALGFGFRGREGPGIVGPVRAAGRGAARARPAGDHSDTVRLVASSGSSSISTRME